MSAFQNDETAASKFDAENGEENTPVLEQRFSNNKSKYKNSYAKPKRKDKTLRAHRQGRSGRKYF
ncbi:MAG: hypothetical protein K2X27_08990 [Candidatus Obscuribacterales bacterium]|nr:hypothetical protein [Candidatus Obscuribacterales bacterium]